MALTPALACAEQNDNKAIILTDVSTDLVVGDVATATLDVTVKNSAGVEDVKSQVNLLATFGPFVTQADMVYTVTAAMLGDTAGSLLADGLYTTVYTLNGTATTKTFLVCGQVKELVYKKLQSIPELYECKDKESMSQIAEADFLGAYLSALETYDYTAKSEETLNGLAVLEDMVLNDSNIIW